MTRDGADLDAGIDELCDKWAADITGSALRFLGHGATLVSGPVGQPVVLAFVNRRLAVVLVLMLRDNLIVKIEATVDPSAAGRS